MKQLPYQACHNYLIVQTPKPLDKTKGGIHLPDAVQDEATWGTVVSIGPRVRGLCVGDVVHFNSYAHREVDQDERLVALEEAAIFCKKVSL